ncbi:DUF6184 family natural product biosynthesis lipoprotein [Archangium violaceum]|uniref:DUF6184 family natural product biosynthesis lipoprotein n=1 Tax=Archangium violaceum TaxID=83451 RepID=UPI001EF41004|nr:DUF6184 family natural product biosynthesis lipoprotein [Archangium violaceum]
MKMNNVLWLVGAVGLLGCGDSTLAGITGKQVDAVSVAADNTCDAYERCGEIGSGKDFTNRDECITNRKSFWNDRWSMADCDGMINGDKLQFCLDAINSTSCTDIFDKADTIYTKCAKSDVCSGKQ